MIKIILVPMLFLLIATFTDIKYRKIKNYVTYPMALLGLLFNFCYFGIGSILPSLIAGLVAGLMLMFAPGLKAGGGDIKLVTACGVWLGDTTLALYTMLTAVVIVCFVNIFFILKERGFKVFIETIKHEIMFLFTKKVTNIESVKSVPMAPFIMIAYALVILN